MAIASLKGENLGRGEDTDMLCVSYSQTDVIGHEWSTRGSHTDEAYLELDKDIARLLKALDSQVGVWTTVSYSTRRLFVSRALMSKPSVMPSWRRFLNCLMCRLRSISRKQPLPLCQRF